MIDFNVAPIRWLACAVLAFACPAGSHAQSTSDDRFETPVATVDALLQQSWMRQQIRPATVSTDTEFCRRVWLDLAGVAPPVWEVRRFLRDESPQKRQRLVETLLDSPRFATHLANRWNETLLPADAADNRQVNTDALHQWLRKQFLGNRPYDHFVGSFLTAGGKGDRGPAIFYTSRQVDPVKLAASTSRIFLGLQIECAQCHDHPTARWTQDDFWSYAAFFAQLEAPGDNAGADQPIVDRPGREVTFPETDRAVPPRYPGVTEPPEPDPTDFRRRQLTIWLASRNNPYFARAAVNRVWAHLFGRGLVEPIDSMDNDNPASHPELLQFLADYLVERRFDVRAVYETLAMSDAYSLSSRFDGHDRPPEDSFAVMNVKTLSAAQYYDSMRQNVLSTAPGSGEAAVENESRMRQEFLNRMQSQGSTPLEYPHGVVQSLGMMNGPEMLRATADRGSRLLESLEAPFLSDRDRIDAVFLACLSRFPTDTEHELFQRHLEQSPQEGLADLTWVLLNSAECFVCP